MTFTRIELPNVNYQPHNSSWSRTDYESMEIIGKTDESKSIVLVVRTGYPSNDGRVHPLFKITFGGVLEYRFIESEFEYEDTPTHRGDFAFGLIEIHASAYIENMASKGPGRDYPKGQRFGRHSTDSQGGIPESDVHHYRFAIDEWGRLDVICLELSIVSINA